MPHLYVPPILIDGVGPEREGHKKPSGHKICITKIFHSMQGLPKQIRIGIFGKKIYHLATLKYRSNRKALEHFDQLLLTFCRVKNGTTYLNLF
jgi:hypothetical protein